MPLRFVTAFLCSTAMTLPLAARGADVRGKAAAEVAAADRPVIDFVNAEVRQAWEDNEVPPSEAAEDAKWLRRASLDVIGQIPTLPQIEQFVRSTDDAKRSQAIARLLEDPAYARHWTDVWTNLLLGQQTPERTSREAMETFLSEAFAANRPWNEIVRDLLTAEGHFEENGAVNFLLGQLDGNPGREDYTVNATARATRLFLGTQVQCTQCHNHPFNDWKQAQFWEIDSFFKQMRRLDHRKLDPDTGRRVDDYSELVWRNFSGPVYFEKRSGVMEVAYPKYEGQEIDPGPYTDRRQELAKRLAQEDVGRQLARAMVNRMWGHFFGYGFTRPVDDMGPHNPPSHPAVLDRLTEEFAASGYDLKQLIRWIAGSEAYGLSSRFGSGNRVDDPEAGEVPLFSRMYVKPLTAEQLYDSLMVAIGVPPEASRDGDSPIEQRRQWLRDYLRIAGGNEEDDPTEFSGSVPQALLMMNGALVRRATESESAATVRAVIGDKQLRTDAQRIRQFYLAALGRFPSRRELSAAQNLITSSRDPWTAYQDLYWALLNSNEFVLNH